MGRVIVDPPEQSRFAPRPRGGPGAARAARGGDGSTASGRRSATATRGPRLRPRRPAVHHRDRRRAGPRAARLGTLDRRGHLAGHRSARRRRRADRREARAPHPISSATAVLSTNKLRQREALAYAGVPQPRWQIATQGEAFDPPLPAVVKAADRTARAPASRWSRSPRPAGACDRGCARRLPQRRRHRRGVSRRAGGDGQRLLRARRVRPPRGDRSPLGGRRRVRSPPRPRLAVRPRRRSGGGGAPRRRSARHRGRPVLHAAAGSAGAGRR